MIQLKSSREIDIMAEGGRILGATLHLARLSPGQAAGNVIAVASGVA